MQDCNVNILGTDYRVIFKNRGEDKKLEKLSGYMDPSIKEIVVSTMKDEMEDEMAVENLESIRRSTLRHEIIHAFLCESGLAENSTWAQEEEMVDWFAKQFPKLAAAFREVDAL